MRNREHFDHALDELHAELRALGELTLNAIHKALTAFKHQDVTLAGTIIAEDRDINRGQYDLEAHAITLIATQQPVARDLRRLVATIAVGGELERIADYAKGIAKLTIRDASRPAVALPADLLTLGERARAMLATAIEAFIAQDIDAAQGLAQTENELDALYRQIEDVMMDRVRSEEAFLPRVADLLFIAHNLERIGDRATNIGERIWYMARGDLIDLNP